MKKKFPFLHFFAFKGTQKSLSCYICKKFEKILSNLQNTKSLTYICSESKKSPYYYLLTI